MTAEEIQKETDPESTCEMCNGPNPAWMTRTDLWRQACGKYDILCPTCFIELAERANAARSPWTVEPADTSATALIMMGPRSQGCHSSIGHDYHWTGVCLHGCGIPEGSFVHKLQVALYDATLYILKRGKIDEGT